MKFVKWVLRIIITLALIVGASYLTSQVWDPWEEFILPKIQEQQQQVVDD